MVGCRVKTIQNCDVSEFSMFQKYQIQLRLEVSLVFNIFNRLSRHSQDWCKRYQEFIQHFLNLIKLEVVSQHSFLESTQLVRPVSLITIPSTTTSLEMFWQEQNTFLKIIFYNASISHKSKKVIFQKTSWHLKTQVIKLN